MSSSFDDLSQILGRSPWPERTLAGVEQAWGVDLPADVHRVLSSYGDLMIDDFLYLFGPLTLEEKGDWMSGYVKRGESRLIVDPVLPEPAGMLHWGQTLDGDRLFLVPQGPGERWTVSAFRRNWGDWYETSLPLEEWLVGTLRGKIETDWMPEWPKVHELVADDD
ncbi:hypothetical protein ACGFYP_29445 [Streptomyces sp. NPDC048370]|uniref:hypothetical protein n=1 Tax=Streptomyces sp. NPDC048370 TaxID=3365540 RepID=UPI003711258B